MTAFQSRSNELSQNEEGKIWPSAGEINHLATKREQSVSTTNGISGNHGEMSVFIKERGCFPGTAHEERQ